MWSISLLLFSFFATVVVIDCRSHDLDIVTRNSNNFLYKGQMINDTNLHEFLENHEREFIFGNNPNSYSYQLLNVIKKSRITRRSADVTNQLDQSRGINLNLRLDRNQSQPLRISVRRSSNLIDDNFVFIQRFAENSTANRTKIIDREAALEGLQDCFYQSPEAAIDLCDANRVQGIFRVRNEDYLIFPLPDRFGKKNVHILTPSSKSRYQLVHNRQYDEIVSRKRRAIGGTDTSSMRMNSTSTVKPKVLHIETAIFVDKDLYRHMAKNYPKNTDMNLIRFVLAMVNGVQLLYHHPSLGREINFVLKRLEILHKDPKDLRRSSDIDIFLNSFCLWQQKFNPVSDADFMHYDHAVILTGLDLYVIGKNGKASSQVVGLAPVAGMCTATSSCTINEGKHFESVFVVAHEIGHNLGMRHDTVENSCDPHLYIMSQTLGSGKTTWSSCSRDYLDKFLDSPQSRCMFDRGQFGNSLDHSAEGLLPGERFDADQQCMLKFGRDSISVRGRTQFDDICRDLHCQRERYTWTSHPALEGTYCGHSKWCRSGVCVLRNVETFSFTRQLISTKNNPQVSNLISDHTFGELKEESSNTKKLSIWTEWTDPTDCESGCLYGESGRLREGSTGLSIYTRSCTDYRMNRKRCFGQNRRYETCVARQCYNLQRTTVLEFANQICGRAKEFDNELTGNGLQVVSADPDDSCRVSCQTKNGPAKSKGWTFPDGTLCRVKGHDVDDESFCVNGRCESFTCDNSTNNLFRLNQDFCPQNLVVEGSEQVTNSIVQENGRDYKNIDGTVEEEYYVENTTNAKVRRDFGSTEATTISSGIWRVQDTSHARAEKLIAAPSQAPIKWEIKSGCHYSCLDSARGVQVLVASNSASNIQLCQPDSLFCDKIRTTTEYASNLCSRYMQKVRGLSGKGMQISPTVDDPERSCKIACQDEFITHRYYLVNGDQGHFPFGTKCSKSDGRYCIRGRCLEFGIDDMPVLESKLNVNRHTLFPYYTKRRKKRSFLYYPAVNITEVVDQRLLNDLLTDFDFHLHIRGDSNFPDGGAIDMTSPIYIPEEYYSG